MTPQDFFNASNAKRNNYLKKYFANLFPQAKEIKLKCIMDDNDEVLYDLYTDGFKSAVTVYAIWDDNYDNMIELDICSSLETVMKIRNLTYEDIVKK